MKYLILRSHLLPGVVRIPFFTFVSFIRFAAENLKYSSYSEEK
jgi:hypothetical protein